MAASILFRKRMAGETWPTSLAGLPGGAAPEAKCIAFGWTPSGFQKSRQATKSFDPEGAWQGMLPEETIAVLRFTTRSWKDLSFPTFVKAANRTPQKPFARAS